MKICQTCSRSASVLNWVTLLVRLVKRKVLVLNLQKIRNGSKKWMGDTKALRSALNFGLDSDLRGLVGLPRWFMMCSWTRRVTLTLPLPNQEYKWVPRNCRKSLTRCCEEGRRGGGLWYNLQWLPSHQEVAVLLVTTSEEICYVNLPVCHLMSPIEKSVQLKWNFKIIDYR